MQSEKIVKEIELPEGISASVSGHLLTINGHKGEIKKEVKQWNVVIKAQNGKIIIESMRNTKKYKKVMGTTIAHIKNMVRGILQNYVYILKICSGHFPMNVSVSGTKLTVKNFLGEKVPRVLRLKEGANVKVDGDLIYVSGVDKDITSQVSADIEQLTRRTGYDSRIFQDGCYIIVKDGKELK